MQFVQMVLQCIMLFIVCACKFAGCHVDVLTGGNTSREFMIRLRFGVDSCL